MRPAGVSMIAILIGTSVLLGGCSVSKLDSLFAQKDGAQDITGSIPLTPTRGAHQTDADLAFARTAASDVLTKGSKDASQPWENPSTGARGSVTPLASAYSSEGRTCRDFPGTGPSAERHRGDGAPRCAEQPSRARAAG